MATADSAAPKEASAASTGLSFWLSAYRVELLLFAVSFLTLAMFSGQRFLRQSEAPHFVYQAKAWLEGHGHIEQDVLPNYEDWACVREVAGFKKRCEGRPEATDRWYSSFPWFPSAVMAPFVAIHGYQLNDTSFGVIVAALALALFYSLLRVLKDTQGLERSTETNVTLAALLGFGTLFFYCALRGEVWFSAEVMGVAFTALYLRNAVGARRPLLAGAFWSMAVLTRTPLFFSGVFFVLEALAPNPQGRLAQLKTLDAPKKKALLDFAVGAAPLGVIAMLWNQARFGSFTEFGHRFFFNNRVNQDIDTYGLFHPHYLLRNVEAAFVRLPGMVQGHLSYDPWGMSLFLTLPLLALAFVPHTQAKKALTALGAMAAVLVASALFPALPPPPGEMTPVGFRPAPLWLVTFGALGFLSYLAWQWATSKDAHRLVVPTLLTLAACALPGLLYQNTGYAQFGFRFSLDYTPYVLLLVSLAGWSFRQALPMAVAAVSVAVNFMGAVGFRGYTEMMRQWP